MRSRSGRGMTERVRGMDDGTFCGEVGFLVAQLPSRDPSQWTTEHLSQFSVEVHDDASGVVIRESAGTHPFYKLLLKLLLLLRTTRCSIGGVVAMNQFFLEIRYCAGLVGTFIWTFNVVLICWAWAKGQGNIFLFVHLYRSRWQRLGMLGFAIFCNRKGDVRVGLWQCPQVAWLSGGIIGWRLIWCAVSLRDDSKGILGCSK